MVSPFLSIPSVNPEQGCAEDGLNLFGPNLQAHTSISNKVISKGSECGEPISTEPKYPLGFENFLDKVAPLSQVEGVSKTDDRRAGGSNIDKVAGAD